MSKQKTENLKPEESIPKTPMGYFWYVSKPFKWWVVGAVGLIVLAVTLGKSTAFIFKLIVDSVESGNVDYALWFALSYPVVIFLEQLIFRGSAFFMRVWMMGSERYSYNILYRYLIRHSRSYFSDRFAGSLLSKVSNVNGAIINMIMDLLWTHLVALVSVVITIGFLLSIDLSAGFTFIVLVCALVYLNKKMAPIKAGYSKKFATTATSLKASLVDSISNVLAVRQYARFGQEEAGFEKHTDDYSSAAGDSWGYTEKMLFWNTLVLFIFSIFMFWRLMMGWEKGDVSTGDLVLILALYSQIAGTLVFIGRAFNQMSKAIGEMEEGLEDLLLDHEINDIHGAQALEVKKAQIDWSSVGFKFDNKAVFSDFNLSIPAGQRLGLVGQSGAGKTTFVSLLLRQHDIESGSIAIDRQNISEVTQDSLRRNIAVVPQEPALFHRTVRENILYGNPDASEEEMIEVAKKAQAHDFIMELTDGYDTMVGERGVKLSGGQKQRVAIARAMLKDAPILVLDEATSALDSESEVLIQKALEALMEGRTVIAIAHRLSTLRKMDRIIVMEAGKITEDGNHDSLAESGGVYEKLWNHQAGGFLQE